ncbi:uncharacterized protein LOC126662040 [Mercurialis annua]|uniref:uncharacterized protein LOC126662040 n=1 Tax=Mercurialis annua TaxID=3986 RepID=UPI00215FF226|nr:uncharacterized protein LOC126662040 [Mercurialis annua]
MSETTNSKMKLKLLIDKKAQKVLFAEASKGFVDFLFSLMSLPLGNIIRVLTKSNMVGCLGNLYESIETLSYSYLQPSQHKDFILKSKSPLLPVDTPLLLPDTNSGHPKMYICDTPNHCYVTFEPDTPCPTCKTLMNYEPTFISSESDKQVTAKYGEGGFVKDVVTYMVMDDLEVKPICTVSSITLINTFGITDLGSLQEKVVDFGVAEGLMLLQVSLQAKDVLTSVFLKT